MTDSQGETRVWELMEEIGFCMLSSLDVSEGRPSTSIGTNDLLIRSRPMAAHVCRDENAIYFLTDADSAKDEDIEARPQVNLAFADTKGQTYVSLTGRAAVSNDREKISELFSTPAKAWWDDADDPSIRVLKVTPHDAQYWDSGGTVRSYIKMAAAIATDSKPDLGDHEKVDMEEGV
ncbi:pyridoxamine 5'-phosphate oxidase family protein [Enterovirga sp. GCM10030262]|uniref:pyridoxamine 5'-phosphate oxidase family protein n=1 Tax=Enterovirga sp. GCM10030262 TaxID=3273391 RepID=UPI00361F5BFD